MQTYAIHVAKPWRYRDRNRGVQDVPPGRYEIPRDLPDPVASLAIDQGMARRESVAEVSERAAVAQLEQVVAPAIVTAPARVVEETALDPVSDGFVANDTKTPRKPRRKRPAPENKRLHVAENKQTLV